MNSATTDINTLVARADRAWDAADRAFARLISGQVATSAAAVRLQRAALDADADVRLHPDYDYDVHGDR